MLNIFSLLLKYLNTVYVISNCKYYEHIVSCVELKTASPVIIMRNVSIVLFLIFTMLLSSMTSTNSANENQLHETDFLRKYVSPSEKPKRSVKPFQEMPPHDIAPFECNDDIWIPKNNISGTNSTESSVSVVITRCCENLIEFHYLKNFTILLGTRVTFHIYYKCPYCIPDIDKSKYITAINVNPELIKRVRLYKPTVIESLIGKTSNDTQVFEYAAFDIQSNAKEVSGYLKHIIKHYDSLSDFVYFLHSVPVRHLEFTVFQRSVQYIQDCNPDGDMNSVYLALNYRMFGDGYKLWSEGELKCKKHMHFIWNKFIQTNLSYKQLKKVSRVISIYYFWHAHLYNKCD